MLLATIAKALAVITRKARREDHPAGWPGYCDNGIVGCRGYRYSNPCEQCHYDSFV